MSRSFSLAPADVYFVRLCARVAELADALDSGFRFERFPTLSLTFFDRAEPFGNTGDNALFELPHGAIEPKVKLAQKLAQLRRAILSVR